tara:strand:+ start:197 stop:670 length:474 start_codon:yes stop_codon:yes gene_type:complete
MIRLFLLLVTLMSFSVMAQMTETKTIDLNCEPYSARVCLPGESCGSVSKQEIVDGQLVVPLNLSIKRNKFMAEDGEKYFYFWDMGAGDILVEKIANTLVEDWDGDELDSPKYKGQTVSMEFNLLTQEFTHTVYQKNPTKDLSLRTIYSCREGKSLFD